MYFFYGDISVFVVFRCYWWCFIFAYVLYLRIHEHDDKLNVVVYISSNSKHCVYMQALCRAYACFLARDNSVLLQFYWHIDTKATNENIVIFYSNKLSFIIHSRYYIYNTQHINISTYWIYSIINTYIRCAKIIIIHWRKKKIAEIFFCLLFLSFTCVYFQFLMEYHDNLFNEFTFI